MFAYKVAPYFILVFDCMDHEKNLGAHCIPSCFPFGQVTEPSQLLQCQEQESQRLSLDWPELWMPPHTCFEVAHLSH